MKDRFVLITGCSTGIGYSAALILHKRGYKVIATVRSDEDVTALQKENIPYVLKMDLRDSQSIDQCVAEVGRITGNKLFALFNNAAYGQPGAVEDISRDTLRQQFETNLFGTHELSCKLLPMMLKMDDARIVQNSSILGFLPMPMRGSYVASKYALEGLTSTMRMEMSDTNIKFSIIEPGPILSNFRANALKALQDNVDFDSSRHGWRYVAAIGRLSKKGATSKSTLGPEAVVDKLIHALESRRPKNHYYVTTPTYVMAVLTRILPSRWIDKILLKYAKSE
ncbi:SDR family NAD(P)-dependent oxidoreductase [Agaribacterium haliotis]|uniref:SDR family NAD(P)-dependent oxidoreductase n=1 Tax=Agaribacterium haliotis TaxID=2013869 RepID=UPI000BB5910B|nr:SDR family NAD(P)-dependent oxidoreductase [Agaribacterium haliotis]